MRTAITIALLALFFLGCTGRERVPPAPTDGGADAGRGPTYCCGFEGISAVCQAVYGGVTRVEETDCPGSCAIVSGAARCIR